MNTVVSYCKHGLIGELKMPPDKSISHRAIMLASLIKGKSVIRNFSKAADPVSTVSVFKNLGVNISFNTDNSVVVDSEGILKRYNRYLNCGNSGTTMRLVSGILAGQNFSSTLIGDESLSNRPMKRIIEPLTQMGAVIYSYNNYAPLYINGQKLYGINYKTQLASAQVKSCVLLAGLNAECSTTVTEPSLSRNHTEIMMQYLNADIEIDGLSVTVRPSAMEPKTIEIPSDISSAAFFIVAAMIVPKSDLIMRNIGLNPTRTGIIDVARKMGGNIEILDERIVCGELVGDIRVKYSENLKGTVIEGDIIPRLIDELPVIAVLATQAEGETVIKDAADLRNKETDRIIAVAEMLKKLGADIQATEDGFIIHGKTSLKGGVEIESFGDHRLAMSASIAGLICKKDIYIKDFSSVKISFPDFGSAFQNLIS